MRRGERAREPIGANRCLQALLQPPLAGRRPPIAKRKRKSERRQAKFLDTNKVNGVVEQLTQAIADSYKALADRAVALQDQNVQLALDMMINLPIKALHRQAESNRLMVQTLAEHFRKQTETSQDLLLGEIDAYMDLFFIPLSDRR